MKINQIVSEHKKGVRAMKYTSKTKSPVPVYGPDAKDAKLKPVKPVSEEIASMTNSSGKIVANDGKTITVAMPDGTQIQKPITPDTMATDPQGKPVLNLATQPNPNAMPGQQPQDIFAKGKDVNINTGTPMEEDPSTGFASPVNTKTNPPTVMDNGNTGGSPLGMTSSGEEITPQLIARSTDWSERSIQANGKTYPALYSGTRGYRVGKQAYQEIMKGAASRAMTQAPVSSMSTPSSSGPKDRAPMAYPPAPKDQAPRVREAADDRLLDSMLTIAGLR